MELGLKAKKCKRKDCRKAFHPVVRWQDYCSDVCRDTVNNAKRAALLRKARRLVGKHSDAPIQ